MFDFAMLKAQLSPATIVDFGLESDAHVEALVRVIRHDAVTPEQLDAALGDGPALTKLVNEFEFNIECGIVYKTPYDSM